MGLRPSLRTKAITDHIKPGRYERPGLIFRKECLNGMKHHVFIPFGF
jgi:hypothetical protein